MSPDCQWDSLALVSLVEHVPLKFIPTRSLQSSTPQCFSLRKRRPSLDSALFNTITSRPSPSQRNPRIVLDHRVDNFSRLSRSMLAAPPIDLSLDDDSDWLPPSDLKNRLTRTASVGNSWGVTSIGGGYSWSAKQKNNERAEEYDVPTMGSFIEPEHPKGVRSFGLNVTNGLPVMNKNDASRHPSFTASVNNEPLHTGAFTENPVSTETFFSRSPHSSSLNSIPTTPDTISPNLTGEAGNSRTHLPRSSSMPRPRRRSSQQRVSLSAGRLSMVSLDLPFNQHSTPSKLQRVGSQSSFLSAISTRASTPAAEKESFLDGRSISEFVIEGELGRGAYGLVNRAREMHPDGTMGPPLIIKQIIKSRILADCWKKHPKFGTIPIEIYVMSSISSISYVLPPKRPWDPSRMYPASLEDIDPWIEGKVVKGHPNICQLLDFFEDKDYYYLVMPSTTPPKGPGGASPTDLFDLVESFPQGLPPNLIRSYLGQIADALAFLHSKGIVHRDIKDENVVLGRKPGSCILIDFGSSGIVKKNGWDSFSGTLDYAGPEILNGERYYGKEQDVWAFGVVAFVLLVGECPFNNAGEAQEGLESPFCNASIALDERCGDGKEGEGEESDGGGSLGDAAALVRACLRVDLTLRPTFERILECRFLSGGKGRGMET